MAVEADTEGGHVHEADLDTNLHIGTGGSAVLLSSGFVVGSMSGGATRSAAWTLSAMKTRAVQNSRLNANWIERGPAIWYSGLRQPIWPPPS